MLDSLKQVLLALSIRVGSTAAADGATARITAGAQRASAAWGAVGGAIMGALAVGALRSQINAVADAADVNRKMSESLGVSVEWLQRTQHAASLAGVGAQDLSRGLAILNRTAADSPERLSDFGVATTDASGAARSTDAILLDLADRFAAMEDGPRKTALAMELFGRGGAKMIPLLNGGSAAIRAMGDEADALGLVLSESEARDFEQYNDTMERLKGAARGVRNRLVVELLPAITKVGERLVKWSKEGDRVRRLAHAMTQAFGLLVATVAARKLVSGLSTVLAVLRTIGNAGLVASAKIALLVGGLALLALVVEDLYTFATGGDSLIGRFLGEAESAPLRTALLEVGQAFKGAWATIQPILVGGVTAALKWLAANAPAIAQGIAGAIVATIEVVKFLGDAFEVVGTALGQAAGWIYLAWVDAVNWLSIAIADAVAFWQGLVDGLALGIRAIADAFVWVYDQAVAMVTAVGAFISSLGQGVSSFISDSIEAGIVELKRIVNLIPESFLPQSLIDWAGNAGADPTQGVGLGGTVSRTFADLQPRGGNTASVGAVNVSVQGTTNMTPEQLAASVREGINTSLEELFGGVLADTGGDA